MSSCELGTDRLTYSDYSQFLPDLPESVERELKVFFRVRGGDDRPEPRFAARDRRESDALREDTGLKELIGHRHRLRRLTDDDGRDGTLAQPGVEAQRLQAAFEEARVLPQPVHPLRLVLEDVDGRNAGRRH